MTEYPTIIIYPDLDKSLLAFGVVFGEMGEDWLPYLFSMLGVKSWWWN